MKKVCSAFSIVLIAIILLSSCEKKCCKKDGASCHDKNKMEKTSSTEIK